MHSPRRGWLTRWGWHALGCRAGGCDTRWTHALDGAGCRNPWHRLQATDHALARGQTPIQLVFAPLRGQGQLAGARAALEHVPPEGGLLIVAALLIIRVRHSRAKGGQESSPRSEVGATLAVAERDLAAQHGDRVGALIRRPERIAQSLEAGQLGFLWVTGLRRDAEDRFERALLGTSERLASGRAHARRQHLGQSRYTALLTLPEGRRQILGGVAHQRVADLFDRIERRADRGPHGPFRRDEL